jgi:hypothetical protein
MTRQGSTNFIHSIENEQLSSVEFVQDYLQLHFDGPTITLFVWPVIKVQEHNWQFGASGYRDALCGRISRKVVIASLVDDQSLEIAFDDGARFTVSIGSKDHGGPEAGYFCDGPGAPLLDF